jgi:hypothetical protein
VDIALPRRIALSLEQDAALAGATFAAVAEMSLILGENAMPFFPFYTDHGLGHVRSVLRDVEQLVPQSVWGSGHWTPLDSAVAVVACLLHDIAMHLHEASFCALARGEWGEAPVAWFAVDRPVRPADVDWPVAWKRFQSEVQRWPRTQLAGVLGPDLLGTPAVAYTAELDPATWTLHDRLIVGEFVRRHHARISHEIAISGFPGLSQSLALPENLAELGGVVARSHGESLRTMLEYVGDRYGTLQQPGGVLAPYLMGLLRVADYLQLNGGRAPAVLLQLKSPITRRSVEEWVNHATVASISWHDKDPAAVRLSLGTRHSLQSHLNVARLVKDVQAEMDTTSAVLSEIYGQSDLGEIRLAKYRLVSDAEAPAFQAALPYEPIEARLKSSDDLFEHLIGPLYGEEPVIAGRELLQNALDAVLLRRALDLSFASSQADVMVSLEHTDTGYRLSIADQGVGMTPEVIATYFLCAGRSYGPAQVLAEGGSASTLELIAKTGRFGVGVFAAFIFGQSLTVTTRHVDHEGAVSFTATLDSSLIELRRTAGAVGTTIVVERDELASDKLDPERFLAELQAYYCLDNPQISVWLDGQPVKPQLRSWTASAEPTSGVRGGWRLARAGDGTEVRWSYLPDFEGALAHNGIAVRTPINGTRRHREALPARIWGWSDEVARAHLVAPVVAVTDPHNALGLTLDRYSLLDGIRPVEPLLLEGIGRDVTAAAMLRDSPSPSMMKWCARSPLFMPVTSRHGWFLLMPGLTQLCGCRDLVVMRASHASFHSDLSVAGTRERFAFDWVAQSQRSGMGGPDAGRPLADDPIARLAGMRAVASYVTSTYRPNEAQTTRPTTVEIAGAQRVVAAQRLSQDGADALERLRISAEAWLEADPGNDITLTAYRAASDSDSMDKPHPLIAAWLTAVGRLMPWDADQRRALADDWSASEPEGRAAIARWKSVRGIDGEWPDDPS